MADKKLLQVGDVLYRDSIYRKSKHVIDRVTNTLAISKTTRFRREYFDSNWIKEIGNHGYGSTSYKIETPELKRDFEKAKLVYSLRVIL